MDLLRPQVELFRGDLRQRRQNTLADLDLAGTDADAASSPRSSDPAGRIGLSIRLCSNAGGDHSCAPAIPAAPAFCAARMTRLWMPQRQRCGSSAAIISAPARLPIFRKQGGGRNQDAGQAIAALAGQLVEQRLLQWTGARRYWIGLRPGGDGFPATVATSREQRILRACRRSAPCRLSIARCRSRSQFRAG